MQRPPVLPSPEPMPRPTRFFACLEPTAGLIVFNRMSSLELQQVVHLVDHPAYRRRVLELHRLVQLPQAQAAHARPVTGLGADRAPHQRHLEGLAPRARLRHGQAVISSTDLPRLAAISAGVFMAVSPLMVARTTL